MLQAVPVQKALGNIQPYIQCTYIHTMTFTLLVPHAVEEELPHASGVLWCGNNLASLGNQEISPD